MCREDKWIIPLDGMWLRSFEVIWHTYAYLYLFLLLGTRYTYSPCAVSVPPTSQTTVSHVFLPTHTAERTSRYTSLVLNVLNPRWLIFSPPVAHAWNIWGLVMCILVRSIVFFVCSLPRIEQAFCLIFLSSSSSKEYVRAAPFVFFCLELALFTLIS
jgi:hypothetical protein